MRNMPARDPYMPRYGRVAPFEDSYGVWTCCVCGCAVSPDEEYAFLRDDVCHRECLNFKEPDDD